MSRPTVRCETPRPSLRSHGWAARPTGGWRGHGADELGDLQIDGRPTGSTASRFPAEASPVPANHGLRLNDMDRLAPPCLPVREPHPEYAVEETDPRVAWSGGGAGRAAVAAPGSKNEVGAGLQRSAQSAKQSEYEGHCCAGWLGRRPTSSVATDILANDRFLDCCVLVGMLATVRIAIALAFGARGSEAAPP